MQRGANESKHMLAPYPTHGVAPALAAIAAKQNGKKGRGGKQSETDCSIPLPAKSTRQWRARRCLRLPCLWFVDQRSTTGTVHREELQRWNGADFNCFERRVTSTWQNSKLTSLDGGNGSRAPVGLGTRHALGRLGMPRAAARSCTNSITPHRSRLGGRCSPICITSFVPIEDGAPTTRPAA